MSNKCKYCGGTCMRKACSKPACKRQLKEDWTKNNKPLEKVARICLFCDNKVYGKARQCGECRAQKLLKNCFRCKTNKVASKHSKYCQDCKNELNKESRMKHKEKRERDMMENRICEKCNVEKISNKGIYSRYCTKCISENKKNVRGKKIDSKVPEWALVRGTINSRR